MSEQKASELLFVDNADNRLIEPGRICLIVWGVNYRKLVCVVDFIDRNRVLVDGGKGKLSNIKRVSLPMRWLQVTKFRLSVKRGALSNEVSEMTEKSNVIDQYNKSSMGRRNLCIKKKEKLNDFGRFKLYYIKGQFKKAVSKELMKLRAEQKKIDIKELIQKKKNRQSHHPVLRRVVGKFRKKLKARVTKKQNIRKKRLRKQKIKF
eukprot:10072_1